MVAKKKLQACLLGLGFVVCGTLFLGMGRDPDNEPVGLTVLLGPTAGEGSASAAGGIKDCPIVECPACPVAEPDVPAVAPAGRVEETQATEGPEVAQTTEDPGPQAEQQPPESRCGVAFGGATCNCIGYSVYCNEIHGWCGRSDEHRSASSGVYDCKGYGGGADQQHSAAPTNHVDEDGAAAEVLAEVLESGSAREAALKLEVAKLKAKVGAAQIQVAASQKKSASPVKQSPDFDGPGPLKYPSKMLRYYGVPVCPWMQKPADRRYPRIRPNATRKPPPKNVISCLRRLWQHQEEGELVFIPFDGTGIGAETWCVRMSVPGLLFLSISGWQCLASLSSCMSSQVVDS